MEDYDDNFEYAEHQWRARVYFDNKIIMHENRVKTAPKVRLSLDR